MELWRAIEENGKFGQSSPADSAELSSMSGSYFFTTNQAEKVGIVVGIWGRG